MNVPANTYGMIMDPTMWNALRDQCTTVLKSGFLNKEINTPEKAMAIALKGFEMGIPLMASFAGISIVNAKPVVEGQLMLAQIYRLVPTAEIDILERTAEKCVIRARRNSQRAWQTFEYTIEEARKAGLADRQTWKGYTKQMLQWRTVSDMAKAVFPEAVMGAYVPDEADEIRDATPIDATPATERGKAAQELLHAPQPPQVENIDAIIDAFSKIDVPLSKVEKFIGKPAEDWTAEDLITLRKWYAQERAKSEQNASSQAIAPPPVA